MFLRELQYLVVNLQERVSKIASTVIITRSMPLATRSRLTTVPFSIRKFSCRALCWNSKLKLHTSLSSNCLAEPTEIRGDIHDTLKNCQRLKSSSGLRSVAVGIAKGAQIEPRESAGLRNGMRKIIASMDKARMTPRKNRIVAAFRSEFH